MANLEVPDSYKEANEYIKILNKISIQEQKSTKIVGDGVPSSSGAKTLERPSTEANESHRIPSLSSDDIEPMNNQSTSGQLEQISSNVQIHQEETKVVDTDDSPPKAKMYFARHRTRMSSLAPIAASSMDQTERDQIDIVKNSPESRN
ncbi:hypothetical protein EVAR_19055_1 [Eumeta japonica]|uniref:Uncharacterized protein n=1 Tax=Eumeta variegata TaxID=151549 RepID=A0A4C2A421_EUMVA|nr:hypothetical protein EVAR_19055_1 [Eumeta japonica]